jgi:hypothetical protein
MNLSDKPSWEFALEYWWSFVWRFAVLQVGKVFPISGVVGGIMALYGQLDATYDTGRIIGLVSVFPSSFIAIKWTLTAYWKQSS